MSSKMDHRTQYYFLSFPARCRPPLSCQMAAICLPRVQLVYSLCEYDLWSTWPRSTQYSLLFSFSIIIKQIPTHLSTLSCFCFKISSLSVNTEMLFHLCLNQTSNGGDILQSITVCVFWSRVIPGLKGWWWRARYSVTPLCWSEYQVSTCQQPA